MVRPDWTTYHLGIAAAVAARADCSRRQVGCILVDTDRRILSAGYNGAAPGKPGCLDGHCPRATTDVAPGSDYASCVALHAEMNAAGDAARRGVAVKGSTAYVTDEPCYMCVKTLASAGVVEAVWPGGSRRLL